MINPDLYLNRPHRPATPSIPDMKSLLTDASNAHNRNLHDVVLIIASTGIRPGELRRAKWADIDFDRRTLSVPCKSSAGNRLVPFGPRVLERLVDRRQQLPGSEQVLGIHPENSLAVVASQLRKASEARCGCLINLRSIRHFFCTQWVNLGGQPESLARVIGWSWFQTPFLHTSDRHREFEMAARIQAEIEKSLTS